MSWLREHDPGFAALRRAGRAAVVMPAMFAIGDKLIGNPLLATFSAFGCFAMLVLVDFAGSIRERLEAELALAVVGAGLVCLGTLTSRSTALAAVTMAVVGFAVLFAGSVSSVLAGASTSLLLAFVLPVSLVGPISSIPDRLAGWGLAGAASLVAIALLWPAPVRNPLRDAAIKACRAMAAWLRGAAGADPGSAIAELEQVFFATPYRPTGLSTSARTIIRLVDELRWLEAIVVAEAPVRAGAKADPRVAGVKSAAALVLERGADQLEMPARDPEPLHDAQAQLSSEIEELERSAMVGLPSAAERGDERIGDIVSSLDPGFRSQELSFVVSQIARNIEFAAAAERRGWMERLLGRQPTGLATTLMAAQERAGSHAERHSVWLQNSVRGGVALGLAVLLAKLTGVQHGFWVVLGTLSVLRSNALNTGQSVVRALLGTLAGFIVGAGLIELVGTNMTLLWFLLPPVVLLAGLAPAAVGFATGQAAFTLTLLVLFNILQPEGLEVGLVRIEDVALGCGVSLGVGLLFWPRGAAAALGQALAEAYADSARYVERAVEFGMGRCDHGTPSQPPPTAEALEAAAASRRLDDTFRGYLAERGAKPVPLADVTRLVTGVVGLRLTGDAVLDLWQRGSFADGDRSAARRELLATADGMTGWYSGFAASLLGQKPVPDAMAGDERAAARLVDAVSRDLRSENGEATATGVRMIWTGDHLDAARRLQGMLVSPAREAVAQQGGLQGG